VDVDAAGKVYRTGYFSNKSDFNPSENPADTFFLSVLAGGSAFELQLKRDIFVAKLDSAGNFVWARQFPGTYYSGTEQDAARGIVVEKSTGNIYITGNFDSRVDFNPSPAPADTFFLTTAANGTEDIFIAKLDSAGNFVWAKQFAGNPGYSQQGRAITLDPSGNVLTTGYYTNKVDFNPSPAAADTFFMTSWGGAGSDIFVSKLDSAGNFIWAKSMGSNNGSGDIGHAIATDAAGNVFTTGYFSGTGADFGSDTFNYNTYLDIFVSKIDASGNFVWAKQMAGNDANGEEGRSIVINRAGDVIVSGYFNGTVDFNMGGTPQTATAIGTNPGGAGKNNANAFIVKLNNTGDFKWLRTYGSAGDPGSISVRDGAWAVTVNHSGDIFAASGYRDTLNFDPPSGPEYAPVGSSDIYVLKLTCTDTNSLHISAQTCNNDYVLNGITYTQSGAYTQIYANGSGCDSTVYLDLTINTISKPGIAVNGFVLSTSASYSTYQWLRSGTKIPGATSNAYTVTANDDYSVAVTSAEGCEDTSGVYEVRNVGIQDVSGLAGQISVYPNPSGDYISILSPVGVKVSLMSIEGKTIREIRDVKHHSVADLSNGIYLLRITDTAGTLLKVTKLTKQ